MTGGSMVTIITASTSRMHDDDLADIAAYLKGLPPVMEPQAFPEPSPSTMKAGRAQFRKHCQDCHNYDGTGVPRRFPTLTGSPNRTSARRYDDRSYHPRGAGTSGDQRASE
jgi:mono/diheme cytochrome c family protein